MRKLKNATRQFKEQVGLTYWCVDEHNNPVERWRKYNQQRRIAQAACNYGGYIVTGTRHYCPLMCLQIDSVGRSKLVKLAGGLDKVIQGFTDQYGVFLTRQEAYVIAKAAGQIIFEDTNPGTLFSECYV